MGIREQVMAHAMVSGFMLSTAYGQGATKLMPVSDTETLVNFAKMISADDKSAINELLDAVKDMRSTFIWIESLDKQTNMKSHIAKADYLIKTYGGVEGANLKGSSTNGQQPDSETDRARDQ